MIKIKSTYCASLIDFNKLAIQIIEVSEAAEHYYFT